MTSADTIRRLAALAVAAAAAADHDVSDIRREAYEGLREEALRLNRRAEWASDESIASMLPSLSALDEIAALDATYATGVRGAAPRHDPADGTRVEARLRDLAAWATGVRTGCELATELLGDDD
jgi:hypothetical protein